MKTADRMQQADGRGDTHVSVEEPPASADPQVGTKQKRTRRRSQFRPKVKPEPPTPKRGVTANALQEGFFADLEDNIVGLSSGGVVAFQELHDGLCETYRPMTFVAKLRVRRLALLHYRLNFLIDRADAAAVRLALVRYRRAQRLAPAVPVEELLERNPAELWKTSAGVQYLLDLIESTVTAVATLTEDVDVIGAIHELAARLQAASPGFYATVTASDTTKTEQLAALDGLQREFQLEYQRVKNEEGELASAGAARQLVPGGRRYETLLRAARDTQREIRRLELALVDMGALFNQRGR